MKLKTSELTGSALDWAVAKAEGVEVWLPGGNVYPHQVRFKVCPSSTNVNYNPSTSWQLGGPLIDGIGGFQLKIWLESSRKAKCEAHIHNLEGDWIAFGDTALIAAMRCYLQCKLGDEVEIPEVLL